MSKQQYLCILRSPKGACEESASTTDMEAMYAKYQAWQEKFADNIADMGSGLSNVGNVVRKDSVADGPFIEMKELVGGYMMLSATSLEEATQVITDSPMMDNPGVSIEIRELAAN